MDGSFFLCRLVAVVEFKQQAAFFATEHAVRCIKVARTISAAWEHALGDAWCCQEGHVDVSAWASKRRRFLPVGQYL